MTLEHFDAIFAFVIILTGLSLLITVLTQAASALFGLRGVNLLWGIKTLLINADPRLAEHAEEIAKAVLHHPLVSDSMFSGSSHPALHRWKLATAIRKDELIRILHSLVEPPEAPSDPAGASPAAMPSWKSALANALTHVHPKDAEALVELAPQIRKMYSDNAAGAERLLKRVTEPAEKVTRHLDQWFNPMMDRISQRFAMHTRVWTAVFAVILAFGLQLDGFQLFTALSSDAEVRSRVIASAEAIQRKADEALALSSAEDSPVYIAAMKRLIKENSKELHDLPEPVHFSTLQGGEDWLKKQLAAAHIADESRWLEEYHSIAPRTQLSEAAEQLHQAVTDELVLSILPRKYPTPYYANWLPNSHHFWGIIATAALLSLGAPFWFNLLKNLSNLRPLLAKKEEADRKSAVSDPATP